METNIGGVLKDFEVGVIKENNPANKTLAEMRGAKEKLERLIMKEINNFEESFDITVVEINNELVRQIGMPIRTSMINVEVKY